MMSQIIETTANYQAKIHCFIDRFSKKAYFQVLSDSLEKASKALQYRLLARFVTRPIMWFCQVFPISFSPTANSDFMFLISQLDFISQNCCLLYLSPKTLKLKLVNCSNI